MMVEAVMMVGFFGLVVGGLVLYRRHLENLAPRLCERLGLEPLEGEKEGVVAHIGGLIGEVHMTISWTGSLGRYATEMVARYPTDVGARSTTALEDLKDGLPMGATLTVEGDTVRIVIDSRQALFFPAKHLTRWARDLANIPVGDETSRAPLAH